MGSAGMNAANQSTVLLLWQDIIQACVFLAAVGALECEGHPTLGVQKKVFRRASLLSSAKPRSSLPFSLSTSRPCAPNTLLPASLRPSSLFPVLAFASVEIKTYSQVGTNAAVLLTAVMYLAFRPFGISSVGA